MVNINTFIDALKTTWFRKVIKNSNSPWSNTIDDRYQKCVKFRDTLFYGKTIT